MGGNASVSEDARKAIVSIGVTGAGKSTACNLISGSNHFSEDDSMVSATDAADFQDAFRDGMPIRVVDTVGLLSNVDSEAQRQSKFAAFSNLTPYGVDVFLLTEKFGRWTESNERHFNMFVELAGQQALKHTILLVTHISNKDLQKKLQDGQFPESFSRIKDKVAAVVGIESKRAPRIAAADISKALRDLVSANGGSRYSNLHLDSAKTRMGTLQARISAMKTDHAKSSAKRAACCLINGSMKYEAVLKAIEEAEVADKAGNGQTLCCCPVESVPCSSTGKKKQDNVPLK